MPLFAFIIAAFASVVPEPASLEVPAWPQTPTWTEVRDFARTTYVLGRDNPQFFDLTFQTSQPDEDADLTRTQLVQVAVFRISGQEWLEIRTIICRPFQMQPEAALRLNTQLHIGSIGTDTEGNYTLVYNARVRDLTGPTFLEALETIAITGDAIEQEHAPGDLW